MDSFKLSREHNRNSSSNNRQNVVFLLYTPLNVIEKGPNLWWVTGDSDHQMLQETSHLDDLDWNSPIAGLFHVKCSHFGIILFRGIVDARSKSTKCSGPQLNHLCRWSTFQMIQMVPSVGWDTPWASDEPNFPPFNYSTHPNMKNFSCWI